jgi:cyclopropane fatty-acyl-phospholipid synthase-like methyltransferase
MDENEKSIIESLSGSDYKIMEHLPFLLQDLWELGGGSDRILTLLDRNQLSINSETKFLELCCGKGALLFNIIKKYNCLAKGIDLFDSFIKDAIIYSKTHELQDHLEFEVMNISDAVNHLTGYDFVIYGSDTEILGTEIETLKKVSNCAKHGGFIIYVTIGNNLDEIEKTINDTELLLVDKVIADKKELIKENKTNYEKISNRANELISQQPNLEEVLESYLSSQREEAEELENDFVLTTLLLQKG